VRATYALELSQDILTYAELVKVRLYVRNDLVDNGAIYSGLASRNMSFPRVVRQHGQLLTTILLDIFSTNSQPTMAR
jgi:hypothetical protein